MWRGILYSVIYHCTDEYADTVHCVICALFLCCIQIVMLKSATGMMVAFDGEQCLWRQKAFCSV
jgi:hypothetical protein